MKPFFVIIFISIFIVSCGSLREKIEIPEEILPNEPLIQEKVKLDFFQSTGLEKLFLSTPNILNYEILFPSYSIIETLAPLPEDPILRIIELKKRYYTYNGVSESDFNDNEVSSIYADEKFYYLGTIRGGVFQYPLSGEGFLELTSPYESIVNLSITDIDKTNDNLFIASFSGLYRFNFIDKTLERESLGLKYKNFTSLCINDGFVFLGTVDGRLIQWVDDEAIELLRIKNNVITEIQIIQGRILLGTSQSGLYEYNIDTDQLTPVDTVNMYIDDGKITFISYFDDKYWIGAAGDGLLVMDRDLDTLLAHEKDGWFLSSCNSDNMIYFGTHRDGVLFYDKITGKRSTWGIKDGLSSLYIPSLYQVNGSIIISTPDKGIVIISEDIHE